MEKLNSESLMIGDWVYIIHNRQNERVEEIGSRFVMLSYNDLYEYDEIEPIPLTPEILEKNGFTKSTPPPGIHAKCYELDNKKDKYNLTIADYNKYKRLLLNVDSEDSECFNIKCDYVHELQHALRICGITKEIEL